MSFFYRRRGVFVGAGLIILAISILLSIRKNGKPDYETAQAVRGRVVEEVRATGRVEPAEAIELAFEVSGRVGSVPARVGERVTRGTTLATLEGAEAAADIRREEARVASARASLTQLEAVLTSKQASLNEKLRGSRPEELAIAAVKVENAEIALADAKSKLIATIRDGVTKTDDALRNKTDQLFSNPTGGQPQFNFQLANSQLEIDLESGRLVRGTALIAWKTSADALGSGSDPIAAADRAKIELYAFVAFLDKISMAVNSLSPNAALTQATIDAYKADISTARTNVNAAIAALTADTEKFRSGNAAFTLAKNEQKLTMAGSTAEEIAAARAAIAEAEANIAAQRARIAEAEAGAEGVRASAAKRALQAPIDGVVTSVNISVGELASVGTLAVSLISDTAYEIEIRIPEVDIAAVKVGDAATVTLDAYGDRDVFEATVTEVDPAETIVEGVATYITTLSFTKPDERVRSGMTANVSIVVGAQENAVVVPVRAIIRENGKDAVRLSRDGVPVTIPVTIGIRGSNGMVEILEGIAEGEEVITTPAD